MTQRLELVEEIFYGKIHDKNRYDSLSDSFSHISDYIEKTWQDSLEEVNSNYKHKKTLYMSQEVYIKGVSLFRDRK